jgi:hypothetical protein
MLALVLLLKNSSASSPFSSVASWNKCPVMCQERKCIWVYEIEELQVG